MPEQKLKSPHQRKAAKEKSPVTRALLTGALIIASAVLVSYSLSEMPQAAASGSMTKSHFETGTQVQLQSQAVATIAVTPNGLKNPAQKLIFEHLEAIRLRDADRALSHTTQAFNARYEESGDFLQWIRFELRPLYNFEDYTFLGSFELEDGIVQRLEVRDRYRHKPVVIIYKIKKIDDGNWRIDSLAVLDDKTRPI